LSKKLSNSLLTILIVVAVDQVSKYLVYSNLKLYQSIPLIDDILRITYIHNPNSVFGLSLGSRFPYPLMIIVLILIVGVIWFFERRAEFYYLYSAIIGGAIGNLIDRVRFHEVVDFIDIGISKNLRWPVFNIADASISISVVLILILSLKKSGSEVD